MTKSLKDYENGKSKYICPRFLFVSSMLFLFQAPCLRKHICISAEPTPLLPSVCLSSALSCAPCPPPHNPQHGLHKKMMLLMEKLIKPSCLVFRLTTLSQRLGSCVSVVHTSASFLSKCLEWRFISFYWLGLKNLCCVFEEHINQRGWHHTSFPLGAEEEGNLLKLHAFFVMSCF